MKTISAGEIQFAYARRYFQEFVSSRPGVAEVLKKVKTPALVVDLEGVRSKYVQIRYHLPEVNVYYAVKANDHI
ncbi:MAG: type III PLP-dependent enzyme, partial [Aquificota bacterium]|nr:type III PLP-dependent enzyme [Aquificota bacterium]